MYVTCSPIQQRHGHKGEIHEGINRCSSFVSFRMKSNLTFIAIAGVLLLINFSHGRISADECGVTSDESGKNVKDIPLSDLKKCKVFGSKCFEILAKRSGGPEKIQFDDVMKTIQLRVYGADEAKKMKVNDLNDVFSSLDPATFGSDLTEKDISEKADEDIVKKHACKGLDKKEVDKMKDKTKKKALIKRCNWVFKSSASILSVSAGALFLALFITMLLSN